MKKLILLICISFFFSCNQDKKDNDQPIANSEPVSNESLNRVEPPHWWVGMNNSNLQLLVHHENIGSYTPTISYAGVSIEKVHTAKSPNYLFIDLALDNASEGKFDIVFKNDQGDEKKHTYELKSREKSAEDYVGFNNTDVVYLITPDRFANANPENDLSEDLNEKTINRSDDYARHGGDIQGITEHLDYISDLGFTAIWSSPLLINDMHQGSYHGYAITDYYRVDPRFGTFEEYRTLADKGREKGIKLIMDQVANHCGLEHWWMKDLPFEDWLNYQKNYEDNIENWNWEVTKFSNHRRTSNQDTYASKVDKQDNTDGWFVDAMPDLNQRNPFMAKYIIQNSIWWIEALGLGGIRQDTYPYPDKDFMSDWAGAIMEEYPNFNIVGEEWSYNPLLIAYWQEGNNNKDGYDSNLRSTMDFAMQRNIVEALNEQESWDRGLVKMYEGLANDFAYVTPKDIMIFPDNHDMSRIYTQLKGDIPNTKAALSYLLTLPRTPQIYYGTEILMDDFDKPGDHGLIRTDFPGGWQGDAVNAFTGEGLADDKKDMQSYLKKVLNYRKTSDAIHDGKTVHFAPFMGTYFIYRVKGDETVVHIINKNTEPIEIDLKRHAEMGLEGKTLKNIVTGETMTWGDSIKLSERGSTILTTKL
ncbi:alpha-amylase family glycosyl hydrolase [Winogradskyella sp. 3972H.M.0a.05]|uniref:glycoside hydrolase family 13 protein n=1 Tax=Winogradskyella sp. 3972H.M.0a.05 TaxID=2950277 RepID=UPI003392037A